MEMKTVQKKKAKGIFINIRISEEESRFMKKNGISPSLVLRESLKELMKE